MRPIRTPIAAVMATLALCLPVALAAPPPQGQPDDPVTAHAEPRWLKGNLHTHSLWSDGNDYPEMVVDWYARNGYQFLALSDHNTLSQGPRWMAVKEANRRAKEDGFARYRNRFGNAWVETRTVDGDEQVRLKPLGEFRALFERPGCFLLIQGEEITDRFERKPIHMNATNVLELIRPRGGKSVAEVMANNLAAVEEQSKRLGRPILGHLNHPNFGYAITAEELAMVTKERFFEVYNGHPDVHHVGDEAHVGVERMWDIINTLRIGEMKAAPVSGLATDDSHNYFGTGGSSPGRGWVMVRSRFLTPESVIKGIEAGDFYASSGVTLKDVRYSPEAKALELEIEPQGDARYTTQFIGTLGGYDPARKPVTDEEGKSLPVTQRYSDDVGKVLATVQGARATYRLTGEELYVRAVVTSDRPPENPSFKGQKAQAWTQPVGWQGWIKEVGGKPLERREGRRAEDFTDVDPASLGVRPVPAQEDSRTRFVGGGKNPTALIRTLKEINGRSVADLEADMRPGADSEKGFLGGDEGLIDVLAGDNEFVVEESGLTHQELAGHMLVLAAIGGKVGEEEFLYHGRRFRTKLLYYRGFQPSPFRDGTQTNVEAVVRNLENGKEVKYSLLVPEMARRYGFYEGKGTPFRVDPRRVLEVIDFLGRRTRP